MDLRELSLAQRLIRSLWPVGVFKDASRGDLYARAAAYRHNRRMRGNLPKYLLRWTAGSCLALGAVCAFDSLASSVASEIDVFRLMAAGSGIVFAGAMSGVTVIGYMYLYLSHNER